MFFGSAQSPRKHHQNNLTSFPAHAALHPASALKSFIEYRQSLFSEAVGAVLMRSCAAAPRPPGELPLMRMRWTELGRESWERRYRPSPSVLYHHGPPRAAAAGCAAGHDLMHPAAPISFSFSSTPYCKAEPRH